MEHTSAGGLAWHNLWRRLWNYVTGEELPEAILLHTAKMFEDLTSCTIVPWTSLNWISTPWKHIWGHLTALQGVIWWLICWHDTTKVAFWCRQDVRCWVGKESCKLFVARLAIGKPPYDIARRIWGRALQHLQVNYSPSTTRDPTKNNPRGEAH